IIGGGPIVMSRQEFQVAAFVGGKTRYPVRCPRRVRTGKGRVGQLAANDRLIGAKLLQIVAVAVMLRAAGVDRFASKAIRFIANLESKKLILDGSRHRDGLFGGIFAIAAAEVQPPDQPPADGIEKSTQLAQVGGVDQRCFRGGGGGGIGGGGRAVRGNAADTDNALGAQSARKPHVSAILVAEQARYRD